jgi:hypothetical protein
MPGADPDGDALDLRIKSDLETGRLDSVIARALEDEAEGRTRPLWAEEDSGNAWS